MKEKSLRKWRGFIILGSILLLMATGCARQPHDNSVIRLGLLPIEENLPFYVAEQENMFHQAGITVELVNFASAQEMGAAMQSGQIDGEITDMVVANLLKKSGTAVKIAAVSLGHTPEEGRFAILSSPQSLIRRVQDLKNIPIGGTENTIIHYVTDTILKDAGFRQEEIKILSIPKFPVRLEMLLHNEVEAAVFTDPLASFAEMQGARLLADDTKKNISQTVIIFRSAVIESSREGVKTVLQVYEQAGQAINENPEQYRELITTKAQVPEPLKQTYKIPVYSELCLPDEEILTNVIKWMADKGLLDNPVVYDDLVEPTLLSE